MPACAASCSGVWGTYMPIGIALSLAIATASLEAIGWRGLWFLNGGIVLLFVLVFLWGAAPGRWRAPAVSRRGVRPCRRARDAGAAGALAVRR